MNSSPLPWRTRLARAALPTAVVVLLGLLALLGSMQYRWLEGVKQAELSRRRAVAQALADAFARDLDHELGRLVVLLSVDQAALSEGRFGELGDRLRAWRAESPLRDLLEDLWLARGGDGVGGVAPGAGPTLARFEEDSDRFVAADWPADLGGIRHRLGSASSGPGPSGVQSDAPALVMPVLPVAGLGSDAGVNPSPPQPGSPANRFALHFVSSARPPEAWVVMRLDLEALRARILPELTRRHFGSDDGAQYHLSVVRTADPTGAPIYTTPGAPRTSGPADVETPVLTARFDDVDGAVLAHLTARRMIARMEAGAEHQTAQPKTPRNMLVVRMGGRFGSPGESAWRLRVTHREGSLEAAVSGAQRRQAATAAGILVVLAGSVALLAVSQRRARALLVQQTEFVAGVSHELRTPLAVIRAAAENLRDGVVAGPEQTRRYGETLVEEGHRLSEMVEQLLEFAGADASERARRRAPLALPPVLEQAARQAQFAAADVAIEWRLAAELPMVLGEPAALQRVFANLLANALRHGLGRAVAVEALAVGGRVVITVRDHGPGLGDADRARLFEPFYRGARAIEQQIPGSGLGLSVVRRVIEAHGGRIRAEDAPGGGAAFVVELPAAPPEPTPATGAEAAGARS